jgi:hypothetical protein
MTDAMPLLALSVLRARLPVAHPHGLVESQNIVTAGGRRYGDISPLLRHPVGQRFILKLFRQVDPLAVDALAALTKRPSFKSPGDRFNPLSM